MPSRPRTSLSISAVLPAYNEEAIIERTVRHVAGVLEGLATDFEIIVTNDGSRDDTGRVLADLQQSAPQLHLSVVTHEHNRGYGAALASGFDAARKDLIFLTDGDKQFDVAELSEFLPAHGWPDRPGDRLAAQPRRPAAAQAQRAGLENCWSTCSSATRRATSIARSSCSDAGSGKA